MSERVRPFSNGSEAMRWESWNCDECTKRWDERRPDVINCEIEQEIAAAYIGDGTIPLDVWVTAGEGKRQCSEFVKQNNYSVHSVSIYDARYKVIDGKKRLVF